MRCAARNLWASASGDWQKILRDSINFLPYHQPNIFEDQSIFYFFLKMECASHYTNKTLSQGSIYNSQKSLSSKATAGTADSLFVRCSGGKQSRDCIFGGTSSREILTGSPPSHYGDRRCAINAVTRNLSLGSFLTSGLLLQDLAGFINWRLVEVPVGASH